MYYDLAWSVGTFLTLTFEIKDSELLWKIIFLITFVFLSVIHEKSFTFFCINHNFLLHDSFLILYLLYNLYSNKD